MDNKNLLANRTNFIIFIVVIIGFIGVLNYLSTIFFARADLTATNQYTISKGSKSMLRNLDDLITIKVYLSEKELPPLAQNLVRQVKDVLAEYKAYGKGNVQVIYRDPSEDNDIKNEARAIGLQEVPMQVIEKDKMQNVMAFMGLAVMYGDKKEILPILNNTANLEYDLTSRIMRLTRKEVKKIGFFFGNGQHAFTPEGMPEQQQQGPKVSYNNIRKALQEQFEVVEVTELTNGKPVPSDIVTLVVAGPNSLTEREKFEIDQHVMRGGKLVALIDAVNVMTYQGVMAMPQAHNSGDLFAHYGAKVNSDILADGKAHSQISYQVNYGGFMLPVSTPYPVWVMAVKTGFAPNNPALSGIENIPFMWPSSVELTIPPSDSGEIKASYLLSSTKFAKALTGDYDLNPRRDWSAFFKEGGLKDYGLAAIIHGTFNSFYSGKPVPAATNDSTNASVNVPVTSKSPATSIVLIGESDFPSDGGSREGILFLNNLAEWLTLGEDLIGVRAKNVAEPMISPTLSDGAKTTIKIINTYLMPVLVIVFGAVVYIRRRNRISKGA
ncbi:MAG: GldG family protein [Fibrobacteres bacterium]|nr:GldG family protein [Fibrobacterota bacterium]